MYFVIMMFLISLNYSLRVFFQFQFAGKTGPLIRWQDVMLVTIEYWFKCGLIYPFSNEYVIYFVFWSYPNCSLQGSGPETWSGPADARFLVSRTSVPVTQKLLHYRVSVYSINWTYSGLRISERSHFYGGFIIVNYLILDSWNTIVLNNYW